jgi:tetratricopeptide (TPR) repeat protein
MDIKTYAKRVDCSLPIFADFFLKKYKSLVINHPDKAAEIEKYVFKDSFLLDILKGSDFLLKMSMLKTVPSRLFSGIIDELLDAFKTGGLKEIRFGAIAPIIHEHKPEQLSVMIQKESAEISEVQGYEHKFYWLGYSDYLSFKEQEKLFQDSVSTYYTHEDQIKENLSGQRILSGLVKIGLRLGHPQTIPLAKHFLEYLMDQAELDELEFEDICSDFLGVMTEDRFEFDLYLSMECKEFDEAPKCLDGIYKDPDGGRQLFQAFKDLIDSEIDSGATLVLSCLDKMDNDILASLIRILLDDKSLKKRLEAVETYHEFLAVFLSIIWQHTRKGTLDRHFCSDENILGCLFFDSEHTPFTRSVKEYLSDIGINSAGKILNPLLDDIIEKENDQVYLAGNLVGYMDHLKDSSFLPALFKALVYGCEKEDGYLIDASRLALIHLEDEAIDYISARMDELDDCLLEVIDIIRDVGSTKAKDLLIGNFNRFYNYEKIETLNTCEVLLSTRTLEFLDQKIGKNQQHIDRLFLLVTMLKGIEDARIQDVFQSHMKHQETTPDMMNQIMTGETLKSLTLELECCNCGDISYYECSSVYFHEDKTPFIADELTCIVCNEISEFKTTPNGNLMVQMEFIRLMTRNRSEEGNQTFETGVIKIENFATKGKKMSLPDGIDLYKQDIVKNPKDPSNYIGLGNIYKYIGRVSAAKKMYEKAVQHGSCYIEAYLSLAKIIEDEGDAKLALEWLEKGRPFLKRPIICKNISVSADAIYEHYLDVHYGLVMETQSSIKPIKPSECIAPGKKVAKIGKNEKCPCGSGKKYKKCCMKKR